MIPPDFPYPHSGNVEMFDYFASLSVAGLGTTSLVVNVQVPPSMRIGYITLFGHGIDDPSAFVTSVWAILINTAANRYYSNIQDQLAPFSEPRRIAPIPFEASQNIAVRVTNNGAVAKLYAARLMGFFDYGLGVK